MRRFGEVRRVFFFFSFFFLFDVFLCSERGVCLWSGCFVMVVVMDWTVDRHGVYGSLMFLHVAACVCVCVRAAVTVCCCREG